MDEFKRATDGRCSVKLLRENASGFVAKNGPDTLASGENAVAHSLMDGGGWGGFGGQKFLERGFDDRLVGRKKVGLAHRD